MTEGGEFNRRAPASPTIWGAVHQPTQSPRRRHRGRCMTQRLSHITRSPIRRFWYQAKPLGGVLPHRVEQRLAVFDRQATNVGRRAGDRGKAIASGHRMLSARGMDAPGVWRTSSVRW